MNRGYANRRLMRAIIAALGLWFAVALAPAAHATKLEQNESSPDKAALLQQLEQSAMPERTQGFVHVQDQKAGVLIQPAGCFFRDVHSKYQFWIDAGLLTIAVLAMAGLYLAVGSTRVERDPQGRTIKRFNGFERFIHWLVAFCFIVLALTGLNLVFGRTLLQPLVGDDAFAELSHLAKLSHDFWRSPSWPGWRC